MKENRSANWGGKRSGSGRFQRNIKLSPKSAQELAILTSMRRDFNPTITESQIVENLIHAAWEQFDQDIIRASERLSS